MAVPPRTPYKHLRISIARPFGTASSAKTVDGLLPSPRSKAVLDEKCPKPQRQKMVRRTDLSTCPGPGAAFFTLLRRAGTIPSSSHGPRQQRTTPQGRRVAQHPGHAMGAIVRCARAEFARKKIVTGHGFNFQTATCSLNAVPQSRGARRPSFARTVRPGNRGRRECRVPAAPAASRAK